MTRDEAIQLANKCRQAEVDATIQEPWRAPVMRQLCQAEWVIQAILQASATQCVPTTPRVAP